MRTRTGLLGPTPPRRAGITRNPMISRLSRARRFTKAVSCRIEGALVSLVSFTGTLAHQPKLGAFFTARRNSPSNINNSHMPTVSSRPLTRMSSKFPHN